MKRKEYYTYHEQLKGLNLIEQRLKNKEANQEKISAFNNMSS